MEQKSYYHYTYKIYSIVPDRPYYYYGIHSTSSIKDRYFGSGIRLQFVLKKYGQENFRLEILQFYGSREELYKVEKELIKDLYKTDTWCCNLCSGGLGTEQTPEMRKAISERMKGEGNPNFRKIYTEEERQIIRERVKREWVIGIRKPSKWTEERRQTREKYRGMLGCENPRFGKPGTFLGKRHSEETKQKISVLAKERVEKYGNSHLGKKHRKVVCEYCQKEITYPGYVRFHGERCKNKQI